jgi:exodeoxyribonuclease V gamma subunit
LQDIGTGIVVYRASRLEALLDPLIALLDACPPEDVLAPQTVIAAHPGMKQWLSGALARKRGHGGIAANLDIVLPSAWLDRLAQDALDDDASALRAYRREFLRWRIHALLDGLDDARIRAYLRGSDASRRRFQLADRLARIYVQYLVYRPDWLQAWAGGRDITGDGGFLVALWKQLRAQIGSMHRGERLSRLLSRLADTASAPQPGEPLHVFGISHLAPSELAVLRGVAKHRLVVLYVPDPCREFWAGMRSERRVLRDLARNAVAAMATEAVFLEQGHPLLAGWGRMGQHFMLALEDSDAAVDERHYLDKREAAIEPQDRLQRMQESIRSANPALIASTRETRADRSLRVHACHTRLRELEVLRDALLRELSERPGLKPSDIIVMAPDISAYAPLLPAVFGEAGAHVGALPYHIADVALARTHPLFDAFARLLDLPQSRLTAPEVVDFLAVPQVAERFGLSAGDIDLLAAWLRNARVHWGLDAPFRTRFDVPAIAEHTFAWGMDRMLAGYAMGDADDDAVQAATLPDGIELAPLDGIGGSQAAALGALDSLLIELARWCDLDRRTLRASAWAERIENLFDGIFRIDANDRDAIEARHLLLRCIRAIASEPLASGLDPELDFSVVRDLLLAQMAATPERQRFLMGGATFCGMVPQRAIPFRVVAVLGLNDGEFPRAIGDGGLDLIEKHPRMGDRDVRSDDRYLFLQTLMSVRDALHLSFIGEGVRDGKPRNPAAPLAEDNRRTTIRRPSIDWLLAASPIAGPNGSAPIRHRIIG